MCENGSPKKILNTNMKQALSGKAIIPLEFCKKLCYSSQVPNMAVRIQCGSGSVVEHRLAKARVA
ncbi:MAG TPA: hypothetical protein PLO47_02440, partial [Bacillota bacterium]|nr:hypothetical protein [Bacillota bacterium]